MRSSLMVIRWVDLDLRKDRPVNQADLLLIPVLNMEECPVLALDLEDREDLTCQVQEVPEWDPPTSLCHQVIE